MARRAEASPSLLLINFAMLVLFFTSGGTVRPVQAEAKAKKTWCVAKPSSDQATLLANLDYACSNVDCKIFQKGNSCFYPNNPMSHASIAMNLYYQANGRNSWNCNFKESGLIVMTDPSFGSCAYA